MTADSMEERVEEFTNLARKKAETSDDDIGQVIHRLTHESYLMKHTTSDVLLELQELEETYSDAFYDGSANEHIMQYMDDELNFDFWHNYLYLFLAAGLEWAVLNELKAVENA